MPAASVGRTGKAAARRIDSREKPFGMSWQRKMADLAIEHASTRSSADRLESQTAPNCGHCAKEKTLFIRGLGGGGEGGIRTLDTVARIPHFECGAFDHSATSPRSRVRLRGMCPGSKRGRPLAASPSLAKPHPAQFRGTLRHCRLRKGRCAPYPWAYGQGHFLFPAGRPHD